MAVQPLRPEDRLLAVEQFDSLNREFYRSPFGPHEYLSTRLRGLLLASSTHEGIAQAMRDGLTVEPITLRGGSDDVEDDHTAHYLGVEATVLLHHSAETLLRLFLAHNSLPPCPRLEVARARDYRRFKADVRQLHDGLTSKQTRDALCEVFIGTSDRTAIEPEISEEQWLDRVDAISMLMDVCSATVLEDARLYNAAKHGLVTMPHDLGIQIGNPDEEPALAQDGLVLTYLTVVGEKQEARWAKAHRWISTGANLALIALIVKQIEALWLIANVRYVPGSELRGLPPITLELVRTAHRWGTEEQGIVISSMHETLLYYRESSIPS